MFPYSINNVCSLTQLIMYVPLLPDPINDVCSLTQLIMYVPLLPHSINNVCSLTPRPNQSSIFPHPINDICSLTQSLMYVPLQLSDRAPLQERAIFVGLLSRQNCHIYRALFGRKQPPL